MVPQNGWWKFHGSKPYEQMDDLGGKNHPYFWFNSHIDLPKVKHHQWMPQSTAPAIVQLGAWESMIMAI